MVLVLALAMTGCGGNEDFEPAQKKFKSGASSSPGGLKVTSSVFRDGGAIPERHSCKGQNQPPPLQWTGVPSGTKAVALVVTDPAATNGVFVHWIVTGLPTSAVGSLTGTLPPGAKTEPNSADQAGYTGMCPPAGQQHTYVFEVLALSRAVSFTPEAKALDKVKALRGAATKSGRLTGTFKG